MKTIIENMLDAYEVKNIYDQKNALKEVVQEVILCGLSRAGFFNYAAFYGGTALRIFYGLDRFSEDLDFSLMVQDNTFNLEDFLPTLEQEVAAYGLSMNIETKEKTKNSHVKSAFLKGNTKEHMLMFYPNTANMDSIPKNEVIKIKFEVDVDPPAGATFERKYRLQPIPYEVNLYDKPSLFAGKIHAVLGRSWKNRVKGRDLYDFIFYMTENTPVNISHLQARLIQSGHLTPEDAFDLNVLKDLLRERFDSIDYASAKEDVAPFIRNEATITLWSADFFKSVVEGLTVV